MAPTDTTHGPTKRNISGFLKNDTKQTSSQIERGMTALAIRADQGRNPDTLILALQCGSSLQVLSMTEPQKDETLLFGQLQLSASQLRASLASSSSLQRHFMTVPLQSQVIVDGQNHMCTTSELKFGRGWLLTNPDMNGYTRRGLFHLPLGQSYGYSLGKTWFLATERATNLR